MPTKSKKVVPFKKTKKAPESKSAMKQVLILNEWTPKDDNGNAISNENGEYAVASENEEVFQKEFKDLIDIEVDFNISPVRIKNDYIIPLTSAELLMIEKFTSFVDMTV